MVAAAAMVAAARGARWQRRGRGGVVTAVPPCTAHSRAAGGTDGGTACTDCGNKKWCHSSHCIFTKSIEGRA